ncbi:hypothetical protein Rhopal_001971-T1 [Rhodotorula paludigena]|uniref:RRM domain-containing protein n=1 Tax=Rhodotorula paludigena TaxID=86838 RepID=A0AAV5G926_9BASI|nr:hypothetical protein Rhopal_001971-T1 [Rhodotorula paludigena]
MQHVDPDRPPGHHALAPPVPQTHSAYAHQNGHAAFSHAPPPPPPPASIQRPALPQSYSTSATLQQRAHSPYAHVQPVNHADTRTQLFVSNLPFRARWQDLKDLMRKSGTVLRADVALNPTDGRSRGFGVVLFAKAEDAAKAIATYHGYTWQTRVLDVRIDAQDPTGALALAEANRQQALQQQQRQMEQRARNSPIPPPPPPPMGLVAAPYGSMLIPVPSPLGQAYIAAPPPPPPLPPSVPAPAANEGSQPSPFLSPAAVRSSSQDAASQRSPSPVPASNSSPYLSPAPVVAPGHLDRPGSDSILLAQQRSSPHIAPAASPRPTSAYPAQPPPPPPPPSQQRHSGHQELPPQLQHAVAMTAQGPPPPQQHAAMLMPMMSIHPMGYAVPGGLMPYYSAQGGPPRPGSAPPPGANGGQYTNRHLFVGNLPFNCQWQELKDLMRGAGSVLRADIAQGPDGRSRGFGSVLFGTSQDAERAVSMFNGFEFNGRTLKVHFDKFSGAAVANQQPHSHHGPPPPPPPPYGQYVMPVPIPYRPPTLDHLVSSASASNALSPLSNVAHSAAPSSNSGESRPGTAVAFDAGAESGHVSSPSTRPSMHAAASDGALAFAQNMSKGVAGPSGASPPAPAPSFARGHSHPAAPSRITMPPPLPFGSLGLTSAGANGGTPVSGGPFSPMRTHGLPPMTPSMPAFTFGGAGPFAAQPTPPLLPHGMFSPGVGPFSPGGILGGGGMSPFFGPGAQGWQNVAPGGPGTPGGFNPMFPAYAYTPHEQHAPFALHEQQEHDGENGFAQNGHDAAVDSAGSGETAGAGEPSYFPPVSASPAADEASSTSPTAATDAGAPSRPPAFPGIKAATTTSASAPPLSPDLSARPLLGSNDAGHSQSDNAVTGSIARAFDGLSLGPTSGANNGGSAGGTRSLHSSPRPGVARAPGSDPAADAAPIGWAEAESSPALAPAQLLATDKQRRRSFNAAAMGAVGDFAASTDGVRQAFEGAPSPVEEGLAPPSVGTRRASMDASSPALATSDVAKPKPAFGTSIWG